MCTFGLLLAACTVGRPHYIFISQMVLDVPRYKQWGDRAFAVAVPKLWNSLPVELRVITDLPLFKSDLRPTYSDWLLITLSAAPFVLVLYINFIHCCFMF